MMNSNRILFLVLLTGLFNQLQAQVKYTIASPDRKIVTNFWVTENGQARYNILCGGKQVLSESKLGVLRDDGNFADSLSIIKVSKVRLTTENYTLYTGKRSQVTVNANTVSFYLRNNQDKQFDIEFRVSNDGVAFRYYFPGLNVLTKTIKSELSSFHFAGDTKAFVQPMQVARSGWNQVNPCYEEHYQQGVPISTPSPLGQGWVFPALFQTKDNWVLVSESSLDSNYCGSHLSSATSDGGLNIAFPDAREVFTGGGYLPKFQSSIYSPWRVIAIGSLKTIVESTLGTDVARPANSYENPYVKPGKASWSWIMSKDDSIVYSEQLRYIDFASKMNWQYCLIDADWDRKIGYEKMKELSNYAAGKNIGLILWYNSAGDWNTVKYTPKNKLLTHEDRAKEFGQLKEMGITGVKIDFFGGDGQSMIKYYIDILHDAAANGLLVNFHGATIPRGWQRTYPNLLTTEAVRGFEYVTFGQEDADAEANHCAMLPFTRNVFDPMDFTPMNLYKIGGRVKRKTTSGFELATSVIFISGIQHFAESPAGMEHVPDYVQSFLKELPVRWDDVRFLDGFPGRYVVIARKAGKKWYIAGINAENTEKKIDIDLTKFQSKQALLITDGQEPLSFTKETISTLNKKQITMKPSGGFVLVLE